MTDIPHYPKTLNVHVAKMETVNYIKNHQEVQVVGEVGVYKGHTSVEIARVLAGRPRSSLHLFDFEDMVVPVAERCAATGCRVVPHSNSRKPMDSYNWSLMKLLSTTSAPLFDYVYIDGSHTLDHDATAMIICDRLLKPGGYMDFDDYSWTMANSVSVGEMSKQLYTDEQRTTAHVALIVDHLVRTNPSYKECVKNKIFQKRR
jgi:hypothetical protein